MSTQAQARDPTVTIKELAAELARLVNQALEAGQHDRHTYAALTDMERHIKGVQRAADRLTTR